MSSLVEKITRLTKLQEEIDQINSDLSTQFHTVYNHCSVGQIPSYYITSVDEATPWFLLELANIYGNLLNKDFLVIFAQKYTPQSDWPVIYHSKGNWHCIHDSFESPWDVFRYLKGLSNENI